MIYTRKHCLFCRKDFTRHYTIQKFCSLVCANRFNLNHSHEINLPERSENLAELFGILFGDGSVTKYFVKVYLNLVVDAKYGEYVYQLCADLFPGVPVTVQRRSLRGTMDIQISSRKVCDFLRAQGFNAKKKEISLNGS